MEHGKLSQNLDSYGVDPIKRRHLISAENAVVALATRGFSLIIGAVTTATSLVALDQAMRSALLPTTGCSIHTTIFEPSWITGSYFLFQAAKMLVFGRALSIAPVKPVFLASVVIFELGWCLSCIVSPSVPFLMFGRAASGIGVSGIWVSIMSIIARNIAVAQSPTFAVIVGLVYAAAYKLSLRQLLHSLFSSIKCNDSTLLLLISFTLSALAAFVVRPSNPRVQESTFSTVIDPPIVQSWLPWIGHGINFFMYPATFLPNCSSQHGTTFKFKIFGHNMIALSSPTAVFNSLRDRSGAFTVINFQHTHQLCGTGGSKKDHAYLYSVLRQNLAPAAVRHLSQRSLGNITPTIISRLLQDIPETPHSQTKSLNELVHRTLYETITATLFGPLFPTETYSDFMEYEEGAGYIIKRLSALAPRAIQARSRLVAAYSRHYDAAWRDEKGGFMEGASDMVSGVYRALGATKLTRDEATRLVVHVSWAINTNIMRVTTWAMCHLLTDKDLYNRVCEEIRTFVDTHFPGLEGLETMDFKTLDQGGFPLLSSLIQEVLRTKSWNVSIREATQDTVIMDDNDVAILVRKGDYIVADMQSMHASEDLQDNPGQFQPDRFLESQSYKSVVFGAGEHLCAGRHFANFLIRMFIVVTLSRYDLDLSASDASLPDIDTHLSSVMSFFCPREDLNIRIRSRKVD